MLLLILLSLQLLILLLAPVRYAVTGIKKQSGLIDVRIPGVSFAITIDGGASVYGFSHIDKLQAVSFSQIAKSEQRILAKTDEELRAIFNQFDADGGGSIDAEELAATLDREMAGSDAVQITKADATALLRKIDVDGDGNLSFVEFAKWVRDGGLKAGPVLKVPSVQVSFPPVELLLKDADGKKRLKDKTLMHMYENMSEKMAMKVAAGLETSISAEVNKALAALVA